MARAEIGSATGLTMKSRRWSSLRVVLQRSSRSDDGWFDLNGLLNIGDMVSHGTPYPSQTDGATIFI